MSFWIWLIIIVAGAVGLFWFFTKASGTFQKAVFTYGVVFMVGLLIWKVVKKFDESGY